ncbi:uncharacterized protein [Choristoneura fumiferana]|uniref:uncharacterized protein n=1 Tax=Choristoneura fumiferana TaxID=7141 RepID=UPI003D15C7B2
MMYKVLCVVVLCFVFDGATSDVNKKCSYGICKPYYSCLSAQAAFQLGKDVAYCNSRGKEQLVCCHDNIVGQIPIANGFIRFFNIYSSVIHTAAVNGIRALGRRTNPPRTSTARYWPYPTSTSRPQRPAFSTSHPFVPVVPITSTTSHGQYPTSTNSPQRPTINTSHPVAPVVPITISTNTSHGQYPTGTNRPQWPISTSTDYELSTKRPELSIASTNTNYGQYPSGTIRPPQWPTTSTAYHGWPTTSTTTARPGPVATTPRPSPTTTEYVPRVYDYVAKEPVFEGCRELDPKLTTNKVGRPAWDKCIDYQQVVYPCQRSVTLLGNMVRVNNCAHATASTEKIARPNEFPHVVVLGIRGRPEESLQFVCSGTLISERFTLASASCLDGIPTSYKIYAAVGVMQRMVGNIGAYKEHKIESVHFYGPTYNTYHDIALLKSATEISLNLWVIPACLDVFGDDEFQAVATRWRELSFDNTNALQKVFLHQISKRDYSNKFSGVRRRVANQMGYGSYGFSNENCKVDNEGSLTVENHLINCMYTVKGVFSSVFRPTCGSLPSGSYTRVSNYTSWIEKIVWPKDNNNDIV